MAWPVTPTSTEGSGARRIDTVRAVRNRGGVRSLCVLTDVTRSGTTQG